MASTEDEAPYDDPRCTYIDTNRELMEQDYRNGEDTIFPVTCLICGGRYDLSTIKVTARYADYSCWITPCCHHATDSRYEMQSNGRASGWVGGSPTYQMLTGREIARENKYGETGWRA